MAQGITVPQAVAAVANGYLVPDEVVLHYKDVRLRSDGKRLVLLTIRSAASGEIRKVALDDNGKELDLDAVLSRERELHRATHGPLSEKLHAAAIAEPTRLFDVLVRHAVSLPKRDRNLPIMDYRRAVMAAVSQGRGDLVQRLRAAGCTEIETLASAPVVAARARGSVIASALYGLTDLVDVWERADNEPAQHQALASSIDLGLPETFHWLGFGGQGVRVGISNEESGGDCRLADHPAFGFSQVHYSNTAFTACTSDADCATDCISSAGTGLCDNGACVVRHGTQVAGMIGHVPQWWLPLGAPWVELYFNSNSSWSHQQQLDWFYQNGVVVENESWISGGTDVFWQDYYPTVGLSITEATGNGGAGDVSSCGANTICIGGYLDTSTIYNGTSSANPADCSRWFGSPSCDMENPHVVFHGQNVTTTSAQTIHGTDYIVSTGTSLAAPAGAGMVALMAQRWPTLAHAPEAIRALLMASAIHDVDTPIAGKSYSDFQAPDERDGAGIPNAPHVATMTDNGQLWRGMLNKLSDFDAQQKKVVISGITLHWRQRLRAVLSWTVCPASSIPVGDGNGTHADLDLWLRAPDGTLVAWGSSYDSGYEIFEYVAPATASGYQLEIRHWGWQGCSELGGDVSPYVWAAVALDVR